MRLRARPVLRHGQATDTPSTRTALVRDPQGAIFTANVNLPNGTVLWVTLGG
jgi:hypothetical protein